MNHSGVARKLDHWESLAEQKLRQAYADGAFDSLPSTPLRFEDEGDENWWIKRKLAAENVQALPPALAIRKDVEETLCQLPGLSDENSVRLLLEELNQRIRQAHFANGVGPANTVQPINIEAMIREWNQRRY